MLSAHIGVPATSQRAKNGDASSCDLPRSEVGAVREGERSGTPVGATLIDQLLTKDGLLRRGADVSVHGFQHRLMAPAGGGAAALVASAMAFEGALAAGGRAW